jgi:hypothetical protein
MPKIVWIEAVALTFHELQSRDRENGRATG